MHMVIRAIVYARNEEDALARAKSSVFDQLVRDQRPFDYYVTFDEDGLGVSGKDRWGELPVVVKASSEEGQELIEEGWKFTVQRYKRDAEIIAEYFRSNDSYEELWQEEYPTDEFIRLKMWQFGRYRGPPIYLYSHYGEGIRTKEHLENVLGEHGPDEDDEREVYVVPADVHF